MIINLNSIKIQPSVVCYGKNYRKNIHSSSTHKTQTSTERTLTKNTKLPIAPKPLSLRILLSSIIGKISRI